MEHEEDDGGQAMAADGGIGAEVMQRYGRSGQPDAQQVVAVLRAITDVIEAEGLPVGPTSYFAAIMSALEKPETQTSPQVGEAQFTHMGKAPARPAVHAWLLAVGSAMRRSWAGGSAMMYTRWG